MRPDQREHLRKRFLKCRDSSESREGTLIINAQWFVPEAQQRLPMVAIPLPPLWADAHEVIHTVRNLDVNAPSEEELFSVFLDEWLDKLSSSIMEEIEL